MAMIKLKKNNNYRKDGNEGSKVSSRFVFLFLLALIICVINALKPIHIDDTVYIWIARQIVSDPFNPFGFELLWCQWPSFMDLGYIPPVMPYWLAGSLYVFGNDPILIKLSILPFILVFVFAVNLLSKRFSPSIAFPVTVFIAVSPAILPGWNIMLDLPSIAFGLMTIELFIRAVSRDSWKYVIAAGMVAALAVMTKYTALVIPGVMLLYGILNRRLLMGIAAGLIVLGFIISWEFFYVYQYDHTQLLWRIMNGNNKNGSSSNVLFLVSTGCITIGALLPFLYAVYIPVRKLDKTFIKIIIISLIIGLGGYLAAICTNSFEIYFTVFAGLLFSIMLLGVITELILNRDRIKFNIIPANIYIFLFGWLIMEITESLLISPFPAVRRLISITIILTFLGFRLLDRKVLPETRCIALIGCWLMVAGNIVITALYVTVDQKEADAQATLATQIIKQLRQNGVDGDVWYTGHWGFAYYAEKAGMKAVIPDESILKAGDWLIIPDGVHAQRINIKDASIIYKGYIEVKDQIPLHTISAYYGGLIPIRAKLEESRLRCYIFRVLKDKMFRTQLTFEQVVGLLNKSSDKRAAIRVLPALLNFRHHLQAPHLVILINLVGSFNKLATNKAPMIAELATDKEIAVRVAVMNTLAKLDNHDRNVINVIKSRLKDSAKEVREAAKNCLKALNKDKS